MKHKRTEPGAHRCVCDDTIRYDETYDAYYCTGTGYWVEEMCDDVSCRYCPGRPEKKSNEETKETEEP